MLKRQSWSDAICKAFPWTPGCDKKNSGGNGGGSGGGNGGSNTKPATTTSTKAAAVPSTTPKTTTPVKQDTSPTTPPKDPAPATNVPQAAPPATAPAAPAGGQDSPNAATPSPSPSPEQPRQQQPAPASNAAPQAAAADTSAPANQPAPTGAAANNDTPGPSGAPGPGNPQDQSNTALAAIGAGTADLGATPTAAPAYGPDPSGLPSDDFGLSPSTTPGAAAAATTRRQTNPSPSGGPGTVIDSDGGNSAQGSGTTNRAPAIAGAVVGVIALIIIAALLYRYRRSRIVQPILLPFAKRRNRADSVPYPDSHPPKPTMSEKYLGSHLLPAALHRPAANRNSQASSNQPLVSPSSNQPLVSPNPSSRPLTQPQPSHPRPPPRTADSSLLRVTIPRKERLVPLGPPIDPSSLAAGFSIPPSSQSGGSPRNSVSSMHTSEHGVSSRPSSRGSVGNVSIASSGVLNPGTMPWPVPPSTGGTGTLHSASSSEGRIVGLGARGRQGSSGLRE
ncbi:hypothetical protein GE09DRAFT_1218447 [Coniochaeta sp. 2T2.1]|nr:hypothetical protein GE09DRAFT_1218447 [Coniochaeta sp. 2T2.1]